MMNRREFIRYVSVAVASAAMPFAIGSASSAQPLARRLLIPNPQNNTIVVLAMDTHEVLRTIDPGFLPHSFARHPLLKDRVWCVERDIAAARPVCMADIDLSTGEVIRVIQGKEVFDYRGHGFFTPDGSVFFVSAVNKLAHTCHLLGYDSASGKLVENFTLSGKSIHQSRLCPDGTVIAGISWSGTEQNEIKSGILNLNMHSGKTLSVTPGEGTGRMLNHMQVREDGSLVVGSRGVNKPGCMYMGRVGDAELRRLPLEGSLQGSFESELFGIAVDEKKGIVAVSDPFNKLVMIVDLATGRLLRQIRHDVWNIEYDSVSDIFITNGTQMGILNDQLNRVMPLRVGSLNQSFRFGSHTLVV